MIPTALIFLLSAVLSLALTPLVRNFARGRGWIDRPDGGRKLHTVPVPRVGGIAVFISFAAASALLFAVPATSGGGGAAFGAYLHLVVAGTAVLLVGLADDIGGVRPSTKLLVQAGAAFYLYVNGYRILSISNPFGEPLVLGPLGLPLTLLWFVGMSNAFNLIDGLDGLAAGVGLFSTTTLFIASLINDRFEMALLAAGLAGALLGFLRYNFNPASIFLGDSGALFVGFALAAFAVRGSMKSSTAIAVAAPLLALAVPILDASIAVARRLISGKQIFTADGDHIHHRLIRMGFTPRRVVILFYAVAAAFGALSLLTMTQRSQLVGLVVIASSIVTWIGIQQLGYSEFGEVRRVLTQGFSYERQVISNNVYLTDLQGRLAQATGIEQLWSILLEAAGRLEFDAVDASVAAAPAPPLRWRRDATQDLGAHSTWTIPLLAGGQRVGSLVLTRPLDKQATFESSYLLAAIAGGFAPCLARCLQDAALPTGVERLPATTLVPGGVPGA